jgi:hypothetical protein
MQGAKGSASTATETQIAYLVHRAHEEFEFFRWAVLYGPPEVIVPAWLRQARTRERLLNMTPVNRITG